MREQVFEQLFDTAEIARFTPDQVRSYEKSLKYYRDMKNSLDTAFDEGKAEGKKEGREEGRVAGREEGEQQKERQVVINGLAQGLDYRVIAALTGLSFEKIEEIAEEIRWDVFSRRALLWPFPYHILTPVKELNEKYLTHYL